MIGKLQGNISQNVYWKTTVLGSVDCMSHANDFMHHMPIITDLADDRPNVLDHKENIAQPHHLCGKNHDLNHEGGKHTRKKKVNIPRDKFTWRSELAVRGLKMKIWRERVATSRAAVHSQPHAIRKKKIVRRRRNVRSFLERSPYLRIYSYGHQN
jgi:hypothetical protein